MPLSIHFSSKGSPRWITLYCVCLKSGEMKPTQSNKVPKPGYIGGEKSKCDSNVYQARYFLKRKASEMDPSRGVRLSVNWEVAFLSLEPAASSLSSFGLNFFSSPIRAFPVVLQIDSHAVGERRGRAARGKPGGVRIICFVDSFEAVAAFSDVHNFIHLELC